MNLQEILNYRKSCLIHKNESLKPHIYFFQSFVFFTNIQITEDSLIVRNNNPSMMNFEAIKNSKNMKEIEDETTLIFKFDGTYAKPSGELQELAGPVTFHMVCNECNKNPVHSKHLSLDNFLTTQYYYTFTLFDQENGQYKGVLESEYAKYIENDKFYHVHMNLKEATSACRVGSCNGTETLGTIIDGINRIEVPNLNTANMKDIYQLVDKLKLYVLFS